MRRPLSRLLVPLGAAIAALTNGCGRYRPARFADRPVVGTVYDDKPTPVPSWRGFDEREYVSDIYLRRPLFDVVRPVDFPTAGDVNAMDEVPASTWYDPEQTSLARAAEGVPAPPTPPLVALDEAPATHEDALVVRDARGVRYELLADPPGKAGLLTGAEVLGGHLLRGLGFRAPRSSIMSVPDSAIVSEEAPSASRRKAWLERKAATVDGARRVSATLWPNGIDVGIAGDFGPRRDDPNDTVDHHDRRTLRGMKVVAHWIGWTRFGVRSTRDVYVGRPGEGHLVHYLIGTSRAFGTQDLQAEPVVDEAGGTVLGNLVTLGLSRPTVIPARISPFPSLGYLRPIIDVEDFHVSPPYSPFARATPPDEYWAGKRLMDASEEALRAGILAAGLPVDAARHLTEVLVSRRRWLVEHALMAVTPLDVAASVGRAVWLRDRAISGGFAEASDTRYAVAFLDADGSERAPRRTYRAAGELTVVTLPKELLYGLVVLQVRAVRGGVAAPRACDVHVMADRSSARVIGVRH